MNRKCKTIRQYTWKLVHSYCCPCEILIFRQLIQGFWTGLCFTFFADCREEWPIPFSAQWPFTMQLCPLYSGTIIKSMNKIQRSILHTTTKMTWLFMPLRKRSFFSEPMLNFAIFGMFSQWEASISIQRIAITSFNTKLVMDAEPVLYAMKNACRKSWLCCNSGYCQKYNSQARSTACINQCSFTGTGSVSLHPFK